MDFGGKTINRPAVAGISFSVAMFLYAVISFLGGMVLMLCSASDSVVTIISFLFSPLAIVFAILGISKSVKQKPLDITRVKKFNPIYCVVAILLSFGMFCGLGFINTLFAELLALIGITAIPTTLPLDSVGMYILMVIVVAVLPAVFEEMLFRGVMLGEARDCGKVFVCLISGAIFAIFHGSLAQLIYQFAFGVALAFMSEKAGSVIPAIISHFLNNFLIITFTYFGVHIDLFSPIIIIIGCVLLVGYALLVWLLPKNAEIKQDGGEFVENKSKARRDLILFSLIGVVVCVALILGNLLVSLGGVV